MARYNQGMFFRYWNLCATKRNCVQIIHCCNLTNAVQCLYDRFASCTEKSTLVPYYIYIPTMLTITCWKSSNRKTLTSKKKKDRLYNLRLRIPYTKFTRSKASRSDKIYFTIEYNSYIYYKKIIGIFKFVYI